MNEIEVNGRAYVDKKELLALIKEHKMKARAGEEPGFIEKDEGKRLAAFLALNHLGAAIRYKDAVEAAKHRTVTFERVKGRAEKLKKQRAIIVIADGDGGERTMSYFVAWVKVKDGKAALNGVHKRLLRSGLKAGDSVPLFSTDWERAMVFDDTEFAKIQAEKIRPYFDEKDSVKVVRYSDICSIAGRRLLFAILTNEMEADPDKNYAPSEEEE